MKISLAALFFTLGVVTATDTELRCECNGRSGGCVRDALGLRCVDCSGNSRGRRCERCKDGFRQGGATLSCVPCGCHPAGSVSSRCDSRGRCACREGVTGTKCDLCPQGAIGPHGCSPRRSPREDSGSALCFCYGHSSQCSAQSAYSVHNIRSTFEHGPDGWKAATSHGLTPADVHSRWSPKYEDMEVISRSGLPVYLYAPASYLGNKLLSYGQNLSFSLRLDRGIRHPSINDVILEGSGQRVSASLGNLRSVVPCGQKINYTFRLDEQPGSRWRPQLTPFQFQTLLQNLSAIQIRATFGDRGRGYLDNVKMVSARRGDGAPAHWVRTCVCPPGYEGDFCQQCSAGFRRRRAADGAFSPCEPCSCKGGDCDPQTGDCYPADETQTCSDGFYWDSWTRTCVTCPCPRGVPCSLVPGSARPQCHICPPGTTGLRCDECLEGFYGSPGGGAGGWRPCRPCQCNGHIDVRVAGSCDRTSGECLKCVNNTMGRSCDVCLANFYHRSLDQACRPCDCNLRGSESLQCDDGGRCRCRLGFDGPKCQTSRECPACFNTAKVKVDELSFKLQKLQAQNSEMGGGLNTGNNTNIEAVISAAEALVDDLQGDAQQLADLEKRLRDSLTSIGRARLSEEQDVQNMADATGDIKRRQQTYVTKGDQLQNLVEDMKRKLDEAKSGLRSAEFPAGDAPLTSNLLSSLSRAATSLADKHQTKAVAVERSAKEALGDSEKSLALIRNLLNKGNNVKDLIGGVRTAYDGMPARVKGLENRAIRVGGEATDESNKAKGMLEDISRMARDIPPALTGDTDAMAAKLDLLKKAADGSVAGFTALRDDVQRDTVAAQDMLERGRSAIQDTDALTGRVDAAHADTKGALQRINSNTDKLDAALSTLRGFDRQIAANQAQADAAVDRLPVVRATIQRAAENNAETRGLVDAVSADSDAAMASISRLENLIPGLEGAIGSIPPLGNEATKMNDAVKALRTLAGDVGADLDGELSDARKMEADAGQAGDAAATARRNAKQARDAVGRMLQDIAEGMANINQTGTFDLNRLKELEDSVAAAHHNVETGLEPHLRDAAAREVAQRHLLAVLDGDIDAILGDIANLEDILKTIPSGCFNSPPIEKA
ncbi:laminin subunit gamma-2 isoform X1 [Phyllopteryx taeniolatus]|uniref:laminin subunit gamma-2 isoform X1 n=1 Tax=Phyllopteryx taeniolatus TaxID=161469 RepID=UPI002AD4014A|nr:laminin subunit gamma-2 isoform X1 [Phyllopteryx taeniolatus]